MVCLVLTKMRFPSRLQALTRRVCVPFTASPNSRYQASVGSIIIQSRRAATGVPASKPKPSQGKDAADPRAVEPLVTGLY